MKGTVLDYEIVEDIDLLLGSDIIIYGTSGRAEHLYPLLKRTDLNIVACCDGAANRIGGQFHQWQIESFADVINRIDVSKAIIIICSSFVKEIMSDCGKVYTGTQELRFVTSCGLKMTFIFNRNSTRLSMTFRKWYNDTYNMWLMLGRKAYSTRVQSDYNKKLIRFMGLDPILVYQMGKVGSTTIHNSLESANIPSIHIHYFQPGNLPIPIDEHKEYIEILQQIIHKKSKIKIITLFRDPLARNISAYFEGIGYPGDGLFLDLDGSSSFADNIIKELYTGSSSMKNKDYAKEENTSPFSWFDRELKEVFNVDVYEHPFDKEKGYSIITQDNIECLVLKLEKLDLCYDIIRKFVNRKNLLIQHDNIGDNKEYKYLYDGFKNNISFSQEMIDYYYNDDKIRHFYTEEEITLFKKKWGNFL